MSDDELIVYLEELADCCELEDYATGVRAIGVAVDRIKELTKPVPPPADTMPVRVAVAVYKSGVVEAISLADDESLDDVEWSTESTHCAVVLADIPRRSIPVVSATVQEVKP